MHCDIPTARKYIDEFITDKYVPANLNINLETNASNNQARCSHCNSTHIQKISTTERAASVIGFG